MAGEPCHRIPVLACLAFVLGGAATARSASPASLSAQA